MRFTNLVKLIFFIGTCQIIGIFGAFFTTASIPTWYDSLIKPVYTPPGYLFGPVWTILYTLMGIAAFLVYQKGNKKEIKIALSLFWIQLLLNFLWSVVFFGARNPRLALVEILVLLTFIIFTTKKFYAISKATGLLLIPYIFWVSFATILNLSIVLLN